MRKASSRTWASRWWRWSGRYVGQKTSGSRKRVWSWRRSEEYLIHLSGDEELVKRGAVRGVKVNGGRAGARSPSFQHDNGAGGRDGGGCRGDIVQTLVDYFILICGYSLLSFTLASAVVSCHSTSFCLTFLSVSQCFVSTRRVSRSPILRFRHCRVNALSSISAILSQLPCLVSDGFPGVF